MKTVRTPAVAKFEELVSDETRLAPLSADLRTVPGGSMHAVRPKYLWTLIGEDDLIKRDRMVLRWSRKHDVAVDPFGTREPISAFVPPVCAQLRRAVNTWEIYHAIWLAEGGR